MLINTHRLSERNPDRHTADVICLDCIIEDLDRIDFGPRLARPVRLRDLPDLLPHRWKARRDGAAAFCTAVAQLAS
jgi:hypothetical protein